MVGEIAGNEGTEEGSAGENRDDERGVRGRDLLGAGELDGILKDLGAQDSVDVAGVVAEEDATERGKGADHVGLPGDGGLDAVDVLRGGNAVDVVGGRGLRFLFMEGVGHDVVGGPLSAAWGADWDVGWLEKMLERHKRAKTMERAGGRAVFNEKWAMDGCSSLPCKSCCVPGLETRWTRTASADRPFTGRALGMGKLGDPPVSQFGVRYLFRRCAAGRGRVHGKVGASLRQQRCQKLMAAGPTRDGRSMQHGLK